MRILQYFCSFSNLRSDWLNLTLPATLLKFLDIKSSFHLVLYFRTSLTRAKVITAFLLRSPNRLQAIHVIRIVSENQNSRLTLMRICRRRPLALTFAFMCRAFFWLSELFQMQSFWVQGKRGGMKGYRGRDGETHPDSRHPPDSHTVLLHRSPDKEVAANLRARCFGTHH